MKDKGIFIGLIGATLVLFLYFASPFIYLNYSNNYIIKEHFMDHRKDFELLVDFIGKNTDKINEGIWNSKGEIEDRCYTKKEEICALKIDNRGTIFDFMSDLDIRNIDNRFSKYSGRLEFLARQKPIPLLWRPFSHLHLGKSTTQGRPYVVSTISPIQSILLHLKRHIKNRG